MSYGESLAFGWTCTTTAGPPLKLTAMPHMAPACSVSPRRNTPFCRLVSR